MVAPESSINPSNLLSYWLTW